MSDMQRRTAICMSPMSQTCGETETGEPWSIQINNDLTDLTDLTRCDHRSCSGLAVKPRRLAGVLTGYEALERWS